MRTVDQQVRSFYAEHATDVPLLDDRMRRLIAACERARPSVVLDVGCGRGFLLSSLRARLPSITAIGLEISAPLATQTRSAGIEVIEGDLALGVPLADASVDLAVFGEVIEHVFNPDACLDELRRVLRPGGTLIVTTPNLASWLNRLLLLFGVQPAFTETSTRKNHGRWLRIFGEGSSDVQGHLRLFTLGALLGLLRDSGFIVESVEGYKFGAIALNPVANLVESIFRLRATLASGFIVTARRAGAPASAKA